MSAIVTYKLRDDLVIRRRVFGDSVQYVVKDPLRLEYWTIDQIAYTLLSLCDGKKDVVQLGEAANQLLPNLGLNVLALRQFYEAYRGFHFFEEAWERNILLIEQQRATRAQALKKATANPMEIHLPAFNPDKLLERINRPLRFLFTGQAIFVYALMATVALFMALSRLDRFLLPLSELYVIQGQAGLGLLILWVTFLGTVLLHEFGHALTCKHFGGGVYKMGFLLLYFNPCLYCDVTESFFFEKKGHKYAVTLAGGMVNVLIASVATYVWFFTSQDLLINQVAQRVALYNAFIGLIVNFNPLLKYDGYYVLSDFVEMPNLQTDSFKFLGNRVRNLFRLPHEPELYTPRERRIFWIYGLLSITYVMLVLWVVYALIGGWLIYHYRGVGYLLAAGVLYLMSKRYIRSFFRFLRFLYMDKAGHIRRLRLVYGTLVILLIGTFFLLPIPRHVRGEFVLRPGQEVVIRAQEPGFIQEVLIDEGQALEAGQPLFILQTDVIAVEEERAQAVRVRAEIEGAAAMASQDHVVAVSRQADAAAGAALERYHHARAGRTRPVAPFAGVVMTPRVREIAGLGVSPGTPLCEIGDLSVLRAEILMDEQLLGILDPDATVELRLRSTVGHEVTGAIERISQEPGGGELRRMYRVLVRIDNADGCLRPGMSGVARFDAGSVPALEHLNDRIARILRIDFWI